MLIIKVSLIKRYAYHSVQIMILHYLKVIIRNLLGKKVYSLVNIIGLSTGLIVFIMTMLYVNYEYSIDEYHEKKDRIYRVVFEDKGNMWMDKDHFAVTSSALGPTLVSEFPEIEKMV